VSAIESTECMTGFVHGSIGIVSDPADGGIDTPMLPRNDLALGWQSGRPKKGRV